MAPRSMLLALVTIAACESSQQGPPVSKPDQVPVAATSSSDAAVETAPPVAASPDAGAKRYTLPELMKLPLKRHVIEFGASKKQASFTFTIEMPEHYSRALGQADDGTSSQMFTGTDSFVPSFTLQRATTAEPADHILEDAVVTRGTRNGTPWLVQVRSGKYAVMSRATLIVSTPRGNVECGGYVDTIDRTPIHEWLIERCLSIKVRR